MKTLNLLQNMSAEAKVLAMALPMLLLGAMSAMSAVKDPGRSDPSQMDMHFMLTQPDDTARVKPVDQPDGNRLMQPLPSEKPEDAGVDHWLVGRGFPGPSVSSDSATVEPVQYPEVDKRIVVPMPHVTNGEPEEDGRYVPRVPGNEDVYGSIHIQGSQQYPAGIEEVAVDNQPSKQAQGVFTLSGLRVSDNADLSGLSPGLYIVNGKKMLVR